MQKLLSLIRFHLFIFVFSLHYSRRWVIEDLAVIYVISSFAMFFSKRFPVSGLTFRSLTHFEFIFVYAVRKNSNFIPLQYLSRFPSTTYWKDYLFSIVYSCLLHQRYGTHMCLSEMYPLLLCSSLHDFQGFYFLSLHMIVVQSFSRVWLFATPWTTACQASLSFTISQSLIKLMSIESVMTFNHLILCHPLLHLPSIFPSIRVFSIESALCIMWPELQLQHQSLWWIFQDCFPLGLTCLISLQSKGLSRVLSNDTVQKHPFFVLFCFVLFF